MFGNLLFSMISLSLAFHEPLQNKEISKVHWDFYDILRTADHCISLRNDILHNLNPRNHSNHIERLRNDLYQKYIELISHNLPFVFVKPLMDLYCKMRSEEAKVRNSMKPPAHLKGNFTWNFTDDVPENNDYHLAKFKEQVFMKQLETEIRDRVLEVAEEPEDAEKEHRIDLDWLKTFYRVSAYIIMFNLAVNIRNALWIYYRNEDEEELEEGEEEGDIREELAQIALMSFSLFCIYLSLSQFE